MSDNTHNTDHAEDHTGPIKTPMQLLLAVIYSFVVPVFAIIGLAYVVTNAYKPVAGVESKEAQKSLEQRIAKVGTIEIKDSNAPLKQGEEVYKTQCLACHGAGVGGAPKFADKATWSARNAKGYEALLTSALKGKGAMGAQGGGDFEDAEIGRAVVFMTNAAGAKFAVPERAASPAAK